MWIVLLQTCLNLQGLVERAVLLEKKLSAFSLQFEMVSGMSNALMKSADVWKQPFEPLPWRTNQTRQESTGNAHCG